MGNCLVFNDCELTIMFKVLNNNNILHAEEPWKYFRGKVTYFYHFY